MATESVAASRIRELNPQDRIDIRLMGLKAMAVVAGMAQRDPDSTPSEEVMDELFLFVRQTVEDIERDLSLLHDQR